MMRQRPTSGVSGPGGVEEPQEEKGELLRRRAQIYGFLSLAFVRELEAKDIESLRRDGRLADMAELDPGFSPDSLNGDADAVSQELACEYARLFIGPNPLVPPYESCHSGHSGAQERRLWTETTSEVYRYVQDLGLEFGEKYHGIPDHISLILELMQKLMEEEAQSLALQDDERSEALRKTRLRFFFDHVADWGGRFFAEVERQAKHDFYRSLGRIASRFLGIETDLAQAEKEAS
jgi:TorA maturation chaperone TorD